MLYNIVINQKAIIENGLNVNANHIAVMEVVANFILSNNSQKLSDNNGDWFWVSYELIIAQIPMFEIKKDRCRQIVKELCNEMLLEANPNNQTLGRVYLRIGSKYTLYKNFDPLLKNSQHPLENFSNPLDKKLATPLEKISNDNYTNYNTTKDNDTKDNSKLSFIPKNDKEAKAFEVLTHLNEQRKTFLGAVRNFEPTKTHFSFITARLEKYSVEDLKAVIDLKMIQWASNTKMKDYLVPKTLFNDTNFQNYIQQVDIAKQNPQQFINEQRTNTNGKQRPDSVESLANIYSGLAEQLGGK